MQWLGRGGCGRWGRVTHLAYGGQDKKAAISQIIFSNLFSFIEIVVFFYSNFTKICFYCSNQQYARSGSGNG